MKEEISYSGWTNYNFDEEVDLEVTKCWAMAVPYSIPIRKPFHHWALQYYDIRCFAWAANKLMVPTSKGLSARSIGGCYYVGLRPTTPEEEKQREPIYREKMKPWIEDYGAIWRGQLVPEMMEHFERLRKTELEKLDNFELLENFEYYLTVKRRVWEIHFYPMDAAFTAYQQFRLLSQDVLGMDEDHPQFKALVSGFKTKTFEVDRELWRLGDRANELGLAPVFQATPDNEKLLSKLEESEAGRKWLKEFRESLNEYGWRTETLLDCCMPTWIEKPTLALPAIRGDMTKGGAFLMDQSYERLSKEREEAEKDVLSRVPSDKRDWFQKLMKAAQWSGIFSEEHNYTVDCYMPAVGRRILVEIGNRGVQGNVLDDPDDVNFLIPEEIMRMLVNMEPTASRKVVRRRREEYQRFVEGAPKLLEEKLLVGDPDWFFANSKCDPIIWALAVVPKVKPELKADLYGAASTPGVAEGIARVLVDTAQLSTFQPGEILVVPSTNPTWHPIFNFANGVVTDAGGSLAHAIIVAREYGLPCVSGTLEATVKIKTGDRIKVDGDNNAVYILERAA